MPAFKSAAQIQREALKEGRQAEAQGLPVIYIHGRPYADPGNESSPEEHRSGDTADEEAPDDQQSRPTAPTDTPAAKLC